MKKFFTVLPALLCLAVVFGAFVVSRDRPVRKAAVVDVPLPPIYRIGNPSNDFMMSKGNAFAALSLGVMAGAGCSGDSAFYMGMDPNDDAYWSVRCTNGNSYLVVILPDPNAGPMIADCNHLGNASRVSCFAKLPSVYGEIR